MQEKGTCTKCDKTFKYKVAEPSWKSKAPTATCPRGHPWAYHPGQDFAYCCSSPHDNEGRTGINFGLPSAWGKRGKTCLQNNFVKCPAPPCKDFSAGYRLGIRGQTVCPNGMPTATSLECVAATTAVAPTGIKVPQKLTAGYVP